MRLTSFLILLCALATSACIRTELTHVSYSARESAYHHILVCSLVEDTQRAEQLEKKMAERLRKHHMQADLCSNTLSGINTVAGIRTVIENEHIDGVLVFAGASGPTEDRSSKAVETLGAFAEAYSERKPTPPSNKSAGQVEIFPYGRERVINGYAGLIDVVSEADVWSLGGAVEGGAKTPIDKFYDVIIRRTEKELQSRQLIAKK